MKLLDDRTAWFFDLDGTLVDTAPDITAALNRVLSAAGVAPVDLADVLAWIGSGSRKLIERALQERNLPADDITVARWLAHYLSEYARQPLLHSQPYADAEELLNALNKQNMPLGLVTNKPRAITIAVMEALGWMPYFSLVVAGDDVVQPKPHPEGLYQACAKLGIAANQTLLIGDSKNDVAAARAAGVAVIAVTYGYNHGEPIADAQPDALVDSLRVLRLALHKSL